MANTQMQGQGIFFDPRLKNAEPFPVGVRAGYPDMRRQPNLITAKLPALHFYQLAIPAPKPPSSSYDHKAAERGWLIFGGKARCASCHVPLLFSEPGWPMHSGAEIGIDDFQAN